MNERFAVGVDMGATKLAFALANEQGQVLEAFQIPTLSQRDPQAVIADIAAGINRLAQIAPDKLAGVGIGSPGQVFPEKGIVMNALNLGWKNVHLTENLQTLLNCNLPIHILKDTDAALIGESLYGVAQGCSDFILISIGSGLGGAIMANHQLVSGSNGTAAGIGHIAIQPDDRLCTCGLRGCAETLVSGPGLVQETREMLKTSGFTTVLKDEPGLTPAAILAAARHGDELATRALDNLSCGLGKVFSFCISILNPAMLVLGGGLALAAFDLLFPQALNEVKKHSLPHTYQELQILPAKCPSSALGAASLVWYFENNGFSKKEVTQPIKNLA